MFRRVSLLRCKPAASLTSLIKELRFRTDAPIADCSAALKACEADLDKAAEWLRKKGMAKAVKKGGRVTDHGVLIAAVSQEVSLGHAAVLSLCSETDFAARNARFGAAALEVRQAWLQLMTATNGAILADPAVALTELQTKTSDILASAISVLGENLTIKSVLSLKFESPDGAPVLETPKLIGSYVHNAIADQVGSIVGLVAVQRKADAPPQAEGEVVLMEDVARHFVANSGDEGNYVHQTMLGSSETVGQWLKRQNLNFVSSMVLEFGKEPIVRFPAARRPPTK